MDFCATNQAILANTHFCKPDNKLATVRTIRQSIDAPIARGTHEQIDYSIVGKRWRNTVQNAESDTWANIHSDHYPVICAVRLKLKALKHSNKARPKYQSCTAEQQIELNTK